MWSSMLGFLNGSLTLQSCHRMSCWILTAFSGASSLLYLLSLLVGEAAAPRGREAPRLNEGWSMPPHLPTVGTIFLAFGVLPIWLLKMGWLGRKTPSPWGNDSFFPYISWFGRTSKSQRILMGDLSPLILTSRARQAFTIYLHLFSQNPQEPSIS